MTAEEEENEAQKNGFGNWKPKGRKRTRWSLGGSKETGEQEQRKELIKANESMEDSEDDTDTILNFVKNQQSKQSNKHLSCLKTWQMKLK
jgi:hypothetical protein